MLVYSANSSGSAMNNDFKNVSDIVGFTVKPGINQLITGTPFLTPSAY